MSPYKCNIFKQDQCETVNKQSVNFGSIITIIDMTDRTEVQIFDTCMILYIVSINVNISLDYKDMVKIFFCLTLVPKD